MNFVFVSPQFPKTYWNFCDRLKRNGVNVLGIGDADYENLPENLKQALTEYYKVVNMDDYDQMYRAVAFLSFKYGKIDWLESNNEYWLKQDARLRTDFNITTGAKDNDILRYKSKSAMKPYYAKAGIPTARCHKITTLENALSFLDTVGFPVIVKPDEGVGACDTYKFSSVEEVKNFFANLPSAPYVMEEFVEGDICSYDAICNDKGEPLFESMTVWPPSIMDIVNEQKDLSYYTAATVPPQLQERGRAALKSFEVKSRFVHMEFFRLFKDRKGLGNAGDFIGLEVNMRPAGGYTPDMMNYAHSLDVYQIWADMVTTNERHIPEPKSHHCCVYASRRDIYTYVHSYEEIMEKYGTQIVMCERMPEMNAPQMGNFMYTAHAQDEDAVKAFVDFVLEKK